MTSDCLLDPYYMWAIYSNVCAYNQYTYAAMPISLFLNWPYRKSSHLSIKTLIHMICHLRIAVSEACLKSRTGYVTIINNGILSIRIGIDKSPDLWVAEQSAVLPNPCLSNLAQMITSFFWLWIKPNCLIVIGGPAECYWQLWCLQWWGGSLLSNHLIPVQERRNSSALAVELHLSCTNLSIQEQCDAKVTQGQFQKCIWALKFKNL